MAKKKAAKTTKKAPAKKVAAKTTKKAPAKKAAAKTTKKAPAKKAAKKSSAEMLLVLSKTRDAMRGKNHMASAEAADALNMWVHWLIEQAQKRATANGRKTIKGHDFIVM